MGVTFSGISGRAKSGNSLIAIHLRNLPHEVADPVGLHVRVEVAHDEGLPPLRVTHVHLLRPILVLLLPPRRVIPVDASHHCKSSLQVINATLLQQPLLKTWYRVGASTRLKFPSMSVRTWIYSPVQLMSISFPVGRPTWVTSTKVYPGVFQNTLENFESTRQRNVINTP